MAELEEAREEHYREAREERTSRIESERLGDEARRRMAKLEEKEAARLLTEKGALVDELKGLRAEVKQSRSRLRKAAEQETAGSGALEEAEKDLSALEEETEAALQQVPSQPLLPRASRPIDWSKVEVGDEVRLASGGRRAVLAGLPDDKGRVKIEVGALRMTLPAASVQAASKPSAKNARTQTRIERIGGKEAKAVGRGGPSQMRLDIRGKYTDEVEELVGRLLDEAMREEAKSVLIVHGHGAGRLKAAVRSFLKETPLVVSQRPGRHGEGGDGVTIAEMPGGGDGEATEDG